MQPVRQFLFLCATLLISSATLFSAPTQKGAIFDSSDRALDIPIIVEENGEVFVQFKVNGVGPVWFRLDTGASMASINSDFSAELQIEITGKAVARGAGGEQTAEKGAHVEFSLPGAKLRDQAVSVYAMGPFSRHAGRPIAGIIGREFLEAFVVEIDFAGRRIHLYDPKTYQYHGHGSVVPLTFENGLPYAKATAVMLNGERVEGRFVLDLGSNFPLMIQEKYTAEHDLLKALPKSMSIKANGVGGQMQTIVGRITSVELGDYTLQSPYAGFPQGSSGYITSAKSPGNIGAPILSRFRVIFDYAHKRMILEHDGELVTEPFEFDTSGLRIIGDGEAFDQVRVTNIRPGSPAEAAGLAIGDRILSVNGQPVDGVAMLRRVLREPDRQLEIVIRRGDATQTVTLKTHRMI